mgnify:CR=1 FL=1
MRVLQTELLSYQAEHSAVVHLVLQLQMDRHVLSASKVVHVALPSHGHGGLHQLALHGRRTLHASFDSSIDFFPESRHRRHTCWMGLAHTVLDFLRIGVDDQLCADRYAEVRPCAFEDMGERQEVDGAVLVVDRHALLVGCQACAVLPIGEDDTLALARRTTGVEDVADVVVAGLSPQLLHFRLSRQVLAELDEVAEVEGVGVVATDAHTGIIDNHALQCRAEGDDPVCLVILLLLSDEQEAHAGVLDHVLYLLLGARSIEGYCSDAHTIGSKVRVQVLDTIL